MYYQHFKPHCPPSWNFPRSCMAWMCSRAILTSFYVIFHPGRQYPPPNKGLLIWMLFFASLARGQLRHIFLDLRRILPPNFQPVKHSPLYSLLYIPNSSSLLERAETRSVSVRIRLCFGNKYLWLITPKAYVSLISYVHMVLAVSLLYIMFTE